MFNFWWVAAVRQSLQLLLQSFHHLWTALERHEQKGWLPIHGKKDFCGGDGYLGQKNGGKSA